MLAKCRSSEVAPQRSVKRGTEWHQNGATNTNGSLQPHLGGRRVVRMPASTCNGCATARFSLTRLSRAVLGRCTVNGYVNGQGAGLACACARGAPAWPHGPRRQAQRGMLA